MPIMESLEFGFRFGAATIERWMSCKKTGWVIIGVRTPKFPTGLQIYVTKTGQVRIFSDRGEWKPETVEPKASKVSPIPAETPKIWKTLVKKVGK